MPTKQFNIFSSIVSAVLIALFTYTGLAKLRDQITFESVLKTIPIISNFANTLSYAIPITELLVAILLILPKTNKIGLQISILLLITFSAYIASLLFGSSKLPCSCGGIMSSLSWELHLAVNLILALASWLAVDSRRFEFFMRISRRSRTPV